VPAEPAEGAGPTGTPAGGGRGSVDGEHQQHDDAEAEHDQQVAHGFTSVKTG
jgi:hypothetical protein